MSIKAINWAWDVEGLRPVERLLLLALADYADERGSCYPNQAQLAGRSCCSERTVREVIGRLEERGLFTRSMRYLDGTRTSSRYVLNLDYRQDSPVGGYRQNPPTLPADSGDLTGSLLPPNHQNHQNHQNPSIVSPRSLSDELVVASEDLVAAGFVSFWGSYPRKAGKETARKAFARAVKRAGGLQIVIDGARRFAADPNLPEKQFIPHPSTWLNRDGWEDEPLPPRAGGAGGVGVVETGRRADEILRARAAQHLAVEGASSGRA